MKTFCIVLALMALAATALAGGPSLDPRSPTKPVTTTTPPPADPAMLRQGGDTIADAVVIGGIPYTTNGTTTGYTDDYDEACPYGGSTSPDVVYAYTPATETWIDIDLFGSAYDTKVYVYDEALSLIACNDDYYSDYTSRLEGVQLAAGMLYYVVVDGYGGESGDYQLAMDLFEPCELDIPAGAMPEGEPPLEVGYVDCYNFGCQTIICDGEPSHNFQTLTGDGAGELVFHGKTGWYVNDDGQLRDGDYLILTMGPTGAIHLTCDAVYPTYFFEVGPPDCASMGVLQDVIAGPCEEASMIITGAPGAEIWVLNAPTTFGPPPVYLDPDGDGAAEYDYLISFTGLASGPVATESMSFSAIRALYD